MRHIILGKSTGVGAFEDGFILEHEPDYTEQSKTGNHWTHIYKDVPEKAIVITFGVSRGGIPHRNVHHVDGTPLSNQELERVVNLREWKEYES